VRRTEHGSPGTYRFPGPDRALRADDVLILAGTTDDLRRAQAGDSVA